MKKLALGIATIGLLAGSVFAADSYYIFSGSNVAAWGTNNYVHGYTYGTVTLDNPANPYADGKDFFNEGVGKIINASVETSSGVFIAVDNKSGGTKSIADCVGGFTYWHRGGAHNLNVEYPDSYCTGTVKWNNKWRVSFPATTSWTKRTVPLSGTDSLAQVTATNGCNRAVDMSIAEKLAWGTEATVTGYNLAIGNVACIGSGATLASDVAPTAGLTWVAGAEDLCTGYYCNWTSATGGATGCGIVETDKSGVGGTVTATCTAAIANCATNSPSHKVYSNANCTTAITLSSSSSTPASTTSSSSVASGTSSSSIATGGSSSSVTTGGSSSSGAAGGSSSSVAGSDNSSSSEGGTDAIISHNNAPVFGLSVTGLARGLQIASDKNATVSLFNIKGKLVLSQKVQSGTTTISLANQKVGVYYAVAKSGSQKQIVKIVLR